MSGRDKSGAPWTFSDWCRGWSRIFILPVARFCGRVGLSPNAVTFLGFFAYAATGVGIALGYHKTAALMLLVLGPLDAVDGLLAREQHRESPFGAFLDSTVDRYAEVALFFGLLVYLMIRMDGGFTEAALVFAAMTGSLLVSYARARAESLGFTCKVGLLTRFERLLILGLGLFFGWLYPVLVILALFTHATAFHRVMHVYRQTHG